MGELADNFRLRIARGLLRLCLLLGIVLLAPSLVFALHSGDFGFLIACSISYFAVVVLYLNRSILGKTIYVSLVSLVFTLGGYMLFRFGNVSTGETWICVATILSVVFFGLRGGVYACIAQAVVFLAVGLAETAGLLSWREDPFLFPCSLSKAWASA